jgi:hypothetical protein
MAFINDVIFQNSIFNDFSTKNINAFITLKHSLILIKIKY